MGEVVVIATEGQAAQIAGVFWQMLAEQHQIATKEVDGREYRHSKLHVFFEPQPNESYLQRYVVYKQPQNNTVGSQPTEDQSTRQDMAQSIQDLNRKVEGCDSLAGFQVVESAAGRSNHLLEYLRDTFPKATLMHLPLLNSSLANRQQQATNNIMALQAAIQHSSMCVPIDMQSTHRQLSKYRNIPYQHQGIVARLLSNVTCSLRFPSQGIRSLDRMLSNMVPFPLCKFLHPTISHLQPTKWDTLDLVRNAFCSQRYFWDIDYRQGRSIVSSWLIRGRVEEHYVEDALFSRLGYGHSSSSYFEWLGRNIMREYIRVVPAGFVHPSICALNNTSAVSKLFEQVIANSGEQNNGLEIIEAVEAIQQVGYFYSQLNHWTLESEQEEEQQTA